MTEAAVNVVISNFVPALHTAAAVEILLHVRDVDPTYPPPIDVAYGSEPFREWLMDTPMLGRWVATIGGEVIGHIAVTEAHSYLLEFLKQEAYAAVRETKLAELTKLFVDTRGQHRGIGQLLLHHALAFTRESHRTALLAVIKTSTAARRLYERNHLTLLGDFTGTHGVNYVYADGV